MRAKQKVLQNHKQVGKRFIPPMMQIPNLKIGSYPHDKLPQLIWIAALQYRTDPVYGAKLALGVSDAAWEAIGTRDADFACATAYSKLTVQQQELLLSKLEINDMLDEVERRLTPLSNCYPSFPLSFICRQEDRPRKGDIKVCRQLVYSIFDQQSRNAMLALAGVLKILMKSGRMLLPPNIELPDLNAIEDYPKTDESRSAGSAIRSMTGAYFSLSEMVDADWNTKFWQEGRKISLCQ